MRIIARLLVCGILLTGLSFAKHNGHRGYRDDNRWSRPAYTWNDSYGYQDNYRNRSDPYPYWSGYSRYGQTLPPGIRKKLRRGGTLPPGQAKRLNRWYERGWYR